MTFNGTTFNGIVEEPGDEWLNFNLHGRLGIRVAAGSPAAAELRTMLAVLLTDEPVPADIAVTTPRGCCPRRATSVEDELSYSETGISFHDEGVQVIRDRGSTASTVRASCSPPWSRSSTGP